jgi:hypothetical protein
MKQKATDKIGNLKAEDKIEGAARSAPSPVEDFYCFGIAEDSSSSGSSSFSKWCASSVR